MSALRLYRPTLHQIRVFDRAQDEARLLLSVVRHAVEHMTHDLDPADAERLRRQVAPELALHLPPRDARYPLVRSTGLYAVPGQAPLRTALLAYQEGSSLVVHSTWHWDGEGNEDTVRHLLTQRWPDLPQSPLRAWGEAVLLTAVPLAGKDDENTQAKRLFAQLTPAEAAVVPLRHLPLYGTTLSLQEWLLPGQTPWPALLLWHDRDTEQTKEADRLAMVDWPLVALYHLRLEHYAQAYRASLAPTLEQRLVHMRDTLHAVFTPPEAHAASLPPVLTTSDPQRLQQALVQLAAPQYALLAILGEAEEAQHHVRRELENVRQCLLRFPLLAPPSILTTVATVEALQTALTGQAQQTLRQIEADVAQVQYQAVQRTARAIEVLRTRNDILNTLYDKWRNWVIALVGVGLALGQVLDRDVARVLHTSFGLERVWRWLGWAPLAPPPNADELPLLYIRLGSIGILTLLLAGLMAGSARLLHSWKARRR